MAAKRAPHPYSILNESDWIPTEADQTMELLGIFVEHFGHRVAVGMLGWLQMKLILAEDRSGILDEDPTGPDTRSKYRRNLRHLVKVGVTPPEPGSGQRTREAVAVLEEVAGPIGTRAAELVNGRVVARARRSQSGLVPAGLPLLVVVASVAVAAVASTGSLGAGMALVASDITRTPGEAPAPAGERDGTAGQGLADVVPMRRPVRTAHLVDAHGCADAHSRLIAA